MASFSIPLSGLDASSEELSVISNNLANMNTVGFKSSDTNFQDLFYDQVGSTANGAHHCAPVELRPSGFLVKRAAFSSHNGVMRPLASLCFAALICMSTGLAQSPDRWEPPSARLSGPSPEGMPARASAK